MTCDCYGRQHHGETTEPGMLDGSEPEESYVTACRDLLTTFDRHESMKEEAIQNLKERGPETPLSQEARIARNYLTEHEKAFDSKEPQAMEDVTLTLARSLYPDKHEAMKEQARQVIKEVGPETPLGKGARIALKDLTDKEKAFDWEEIETAADKVRTTNAPDILTGPTFSEYYTARRKVLREDLDHMVRIISTPGQDTQENLRHRLTLIARLAELDTARESIGFDGYPEQPRDADQSGEHSFPYNEG